MSSVPERGCTGCAAGSWSDAYKLECGLLVWACDNCGRAEIDNTSADGVELHLAEVSRDGSGRFTSQEGHTDE